MNNITNKILNKKFNKSLYAGYDPVDVDSFFDEVINYINEVSDFDEKTKEQSSVIEKKYKELVEQNKQYKEEIQDLKTQVDKFIKEGYGQKHIMDQMTELRKEIKSLKQENQNLTKQINS